MEESENESESEAESAESGSAEVKLRSITMYDSCETKQQSEQTSCQPTNYLAAEGDGNNFDFLTSPGFGIADNAWMGEFLTDAAGFDNDKRGAGFGMGDHLLCSVPLACGESINKIVSIHNLRQRAGESSFHGFFLKPNNSCQHSDINCWVVQGARTPTPTQCRRDANQRR